jgi:RsiW-degrading membrane proteinase PrsW (M82 family)
LSIIDFYANPSPWGIGLALVFGAVWLAALKPLGLKTLWPWLIFIAGAILLAPCIAWVQIPLQEMVNLRLIQSLGLLVYQDRLLLTIIPYVMLSGLVQEGAKMLPVAVYWWCRHRTLDPRTGLILGAMAGAGFGITEAQWALNGLFAAGWTWPLAQTAGFMGIAGFWERFFIISFHIGSAALAGWGLSRGHGLVFYLLASLMHFLINYTAVLMQLGMISGLQVEVIIAVFASMLFGLVLFLRWRKTGPVRPEAVPPEACQGTTRHRILAFFQASAFDLSSRAPSREVAVYCGPASISASSRRRD